MWHGRTELTEVPGGYKKCCSRTPGIVAQVYRTHISSGYGHESLTELPEVPGIVARAYKTYTSSGYGYERTTELRKFQVRVIPGKMHTSSGGSSI